MSILKKDNKENDDEDYDGDDDDDDCPQVTETP
jgi:hypothetical protein